VADATLRSRLGAEARALVAGRFTWDRIALAAEQELLALVRDGRGRPSGPPPT
jgi:glycosyltransferase involved in cell wall biosynthesis